MIVLLAVKVATALVIAYTGVAESVAAYGVIEIGPNLLSAVTATIGAVVLITQLLIARRINEVHGEARAATTSAAAATDLAVHAVEAAEKNGPSE